MPCAVTEPGAVVVIMGGVYRGRQGRVCGEIDGTNSVRVQLHDRSKYDAARGPDFAWIPVEYLKNWG